MAVSESIKTDTLVVRPPRLDDGHPVYTLVAGCPPLELNSLYCYLLFCSHFAATCAVAEQDGGLVGFIAGYRKPSAPETLFVWQIATRADQRGRGIAGRLLDAARTHAAPPAVRFVEATVTPGNELSRSFFQSFARRHQAPLHETVLFPRRAFGGTAHDPEHLLRIGPLHL